MHPSNTKLCSLDQQKISQQRRGRSLSLALTLEIVLISKVQGSTKMRAIITSLTLSVSGKLFP